MDLAAFVERRLAVARALAQGEAGGTYADACILVSGTISAMAAYAWPGDRIDRKRIVEFWVRFSHNPDALRISVPLLTRTLRERHRFDEAALVERLRPVLNDDSRVLTWDQADAYEEEVREACPTLDLATIRQHSYPAIFYEHIRSKLVHEYSFGILGRAASLPMTRKPDPGISYVNQLAKSERRVVDTDFGQEVVTYRSVVRKIHFHIDWLIDLTRSLAASADDELSARPPPWPPPKWWLPDRGT